MNALAKNEASQSDEKEHSLITEGKAKILVPPSTKVFYNPVQEFNRDLSVAVLTCLAKEHHEEMQTKKMKNKDSDSQSNIEDNCSPLDAGVVSENGLHILEALSATGLRSIRYAKEVPGIKQIIANDISENAAKSISNNIKYNEVDKLVSVSHDDAVIVMYARRHFLKRIHVVDLDPYGCPSSFLDAAVQCVADGGMLLVTATDMAVLAGNAPETCYSKYGAISLRTRACHEMGLRILLQCIESHANRYGRYIVPMLSLSADFYVRVFVKIYTSPAVCKRTTSKLSLVYQCVGCDTPVFQPLGTAHKFGEKVNQYKFCLPHAPVPGTCQHCNHRFHIGGPIWNAALHDSNFVRKLQEVVDAGDFGTAKRMKGVLAVIEEELENVPLYYSIDRLFSIVKCEMMSMVKFRSALMNAGYQVSLSHAHKQSVKTDAPPTVVWDIVRTWEKSHPVKRDRLSDAGRTILDKQPTTQISLELHPGANPNSREIGLVRFQENPRPYWGPGSRSKLNFQNEESEKKIRNQGKRSRSESTSPRTHKKSVQSEVLENIKQETLPETHTGT